MKVLSLFNGMGCIWLALDEAGIEVTARYSSEVDKYAIKANDTLYPDTVQLGDVRGVNGADLGHIDLLAGGSPCQSFSFAGKRKGMSTKCDTEILTLTHYLELRAEGYEFEGQSYLFWEYMRILNELREINPDILFLLENVEMGEKWEKVLSKAIGVNGIHINSALVSAQNRQRIYWTNIGLKPQGLFNELLPTIQQPKDEGVLLKDILESEVDEKYFLSEKIIKGMFRRNDCNKEKGNGFKFNPTLGSVKANCVTSRCYKMGVDDNYIIGNSGGNHSDMGLIVVHNTMPRSSKTGKGGTGPLSRTDGKTYCLDTGKTNVNQLNPSTESGGKQPYQQNRIYSAEGQSPALMAQISCGTHAILDKSPCLHGFEHGTNGQFNKQLLNGGLIRRLTPRECLRLQTFPEWAIDKLLSSGISDTKLYKRISDTQLYKMTGNGWTIKVITHILNSCQNQKE